MLRLRAFRPSNDKIVKIQFHPTQPWLAAADGSDAVVVWDWENRQVLYELNAGGVDAKRLVGAQLQKLAEGESESKSKPTEAIRGGSVKHLRFYDDDVRFWQWWISRTAAVDAQSSPAQFSPPGSSGSSGSTRGRRFLVICCENKAIFLDLVTMRARDVPKQILENKAPLCVEFLPRFTSGDGTFAAFGGSDGNIRLLSLTNWQMAQKYIGGHKGSVVCLMTFMTSSGETLLVSGATDGFIVVWNGDNPLALREISPKLSLKAHDGGVHGMEMAKIQGGPPQLITIGADKTLAIWDITSFKELRRIKPIPKVACQSVASWCHPRAPNVDILTCVKDSHIWAIEHATYMAMTRPLCDLSLQVPSAFIAATKKLKAYCMTVHPLQPHFVATGTNIGVILSEFDAKSIPPAAALLPVPGTKEHSVVYTAEKDLNLLSFQLSSPATDGRPRTDIGEAPQILKQVRTRVCPVPHETFSQLSISSSGKFVSVVWPDVPYFAVYRVSDWAMIDSGQARFFAWDSCKERYALVEAVAAPRILPLGKGGSSKKAKEAAAQAAAAAAAAASAAAAATVEIRILLDDGSPNLLTKSLEGRPEQVIGLQGGALLGVAYKLPRMSIVPSSSTFSTLEDMGRTTIAETSANFVLYSWETFKPISGMLPQPEWSAWDQTVEYCALAYQRHVVISSLRPQYRYLGNVAIAGATGGVWHRRQLFIATPTTIECVFVDAGVSAIDVERMKRKEEMKNRAAQGASTAEHGELALLTVDAPKSSSQDRIALRPPMLQVVRLASFHTAPSIAPFVFTKHTKGEVEATGSQKDLEDKKVADVAIGGGGVAVAVSRLPIEQKRPVGPLVVVGVRDGVLWIVDRFMVAHAIWLSHPGIRCRCLAAHGDAVSAVKWAFRLGREHHDDLAQFMLGMGYATEALHLPGISKRLEYELAMQSGDLKRALQCLVTLSNSKTLGQEADAVSLALTTKEKTSDALQGIVKFSKEFLELVDAADATAQSEISTEALKKLAVAGAVEGALDPTVLRALSLRLAAHGEMTRLALLVNSMMGAGHGREAAIAAALLGDPAISEKAWQETGMIAEATLHAYAHGRPSLKSLLERWNRMLQLEQEIRPTELLSMEKEAVLENLAEPTKKAAIEIVPPGLVASTQQKKAALSTAAAAATPVLMLEAPPLRAPAPQTVAS
ncbi:hypothetical protein SELMODRAFT_92496 [Selaginella moellendorffii]|uniref:Uncharacterized protein n=1 Tax=Selaginella moellendorffii TaxID=88036 RepID=D8RG57_SELML|nr:uncharacterized protein LOC9645689 [Selaginella moellendorffii]EFJ28983.1 hypothetical protein SELMODRAFT_92496 [Selaginella moellendorffii]|eukprot:XP_002969859.1 uncharacterized protein LOC9645689 [Selaginella moellendorffii]